MDLLLDSLLPSERLSFEDVDCFKHEAKASHIGRRNSN